MIDPKKYIDGRQFRQALDAKIRAFAQANKISIEDLRRQIVFDRFLARLDFSEFVLTGGYSLELRLPLSRSTTDIDLYARDRRLLVGTTDEQSDSILSLLRGQTAKVIPDHFSFEVERLIGRLHGPQDGGARCLIMAMLNNREYYKFHVDVALCREILEPEILNHKSLADGAEYQILALKKEELFANKVHAYTRLRNQENSRIEDLVDLALLIADGLATESVKLALTGVFDASDVHRIIPNELKLPPQSWKNEFSAISNRRNLNLTIEQAFDRVSTFYKNLHVGI